MGSTVSVPNACDALNVFGRDLSRSVWRWIIEATAVACVLSGQMAFAQQALTESQDDSVLHVALLPLRSVPVSVTAHTVEQDDQWYIEADVTNTAAAPLTRIELVVMIRNVAGGAIDRQSEELSLEMPLTPGEVRRLRFLTRATGRDSRLWLGIAAAETSLDRWTNDNLAADMEVAKPKQAVSPEQSTLTPDSQDVVILRDDHCPAQIGDITVSRNALGIVSTVHVVLTNTLNTPARITVTVLSFDERGLRARFFMPTTRPIGGLETGSVNVVPNHPFATKKWRFVIAVDKVEGANGLCVNEHLRQTAEATLGLQQR